MSAAYDVLVIGAGHNGLTAAGLLARRGRKVLVLERREVVGGMAAPEEFQPGYRSAGLLQDTAGVRPSVVRALELERHGLRVRDRPPDVLALGDDGSGVLLSGSVERAAREIAGRSPPDAERYARYRAFLGRVRRVVGRFFDEPPLNLVDLESAGRWEPIKHALRIRRLGSRDMLELLRLPPMCAADWLGEWFEDDLLKAALALPAISGTFLGPRSPGSNFNLLLREAAAGPGVEGDGPALIAALEKSVRDHGVEIRTGATVERVLLGRHSVEGVALAGGEEIRAVVVAASCDPKRLFLELLSPGSIARRLEHRIEKFRTRGTTAQVLLALNRPLRFACRPEQPVELARTGGDLIRLERAFDAVKYRKLPDEPVLEVHVPTVSCPGLAPDGHEVASILVHFVPYDLEPGWDDEQQERLADRVVTILERHAPGVTAATVARQVLSPVDLEARYALTGGHVHHGEHALDQLLIRPAPECVGYRTPIPGLFLCGSGSHPGGGLTCAPGRLAARAILRG